MSTPQVIDIQDWIRNEVLPRRRMDAHIHEIVFGQPSLGFAAYEADYDIIRNPTTEYMKSNGECSCTDPVYLNKCVCDKKDAFYAKTKLDSSTAKFFGHYADCLRVVPQYTANTTEALYLVHILRHILKYTIESQVTGWRVQLESVLRTGGFESSICSESLPMAIGDLLLIYFKMHTEGFPLKQMEDL